MTTAKSTECLPMALFDTLDYLSTHDHYISSQVQPQDFEPARQFILSYRGSPDTFNAYRREIERLLQWLSLVAKKTLREVKRQDFEDYLNFCQKPPLPWVGLSQVPRFITHNGKRVPNPNWRPFVASILKNTAKNNEEILKNYKLSKKAFHQILGINSSFFNFLIEEGVTEINPILQIRQKSKYLAATPTQHIVRRLSELQWSYCIETAEKMAADNPALHERTLFIMNALYGMYLRISELTSTSRWEPQMKDFHRDTEGNWWFTTVGKGNKERRIAVSNSMLEALKRYRVSLNLSPTPGPGETLPLIPKQKGGSAIKSTRRLRGIVQACFDKTIERLIQDGFTEDADALKSATVHWLRHTGISEDVKHRPREHVRDDAGHGSGAITDRYIDVELQARHASAKNKRINPDKA